MPSVDGFARLIEAIQDLSSGAAGPAQYSLAVAAMGFVTIAIAVAVSSPFLRHARGPEMIIRIVVTAGATIAGVAVFSLLWAVLFLPPPSAAPREVAVLPPIPTPASTSTPSRILMPATFPPDTPEPTDTPAPPEATDTPYVEPPATPTPEIRSAFLANPDERDDSWVLDTRARVIAKPLMSVLSDAKSGFAHYREDPGPPYKTWAIFVDFSCKVTEAPPLPIAAEPPRLSLQCTSYKTFFPDAAQMQIETLALDLASVMESGSVSSENEFRDWSQINVLRFPTAVFYIGERNFADGTHVVFELVPT
jgi:hypothetical protein